MTKKMLGWLGLGVACLACCIPLVAGSLTALGIGAAVSAGIGGVSWEALLCLGVPAFAVGVAAVLWASSRRKRERSCNCEASCGL